MAAIDERVPSCGDLKYSKDINIVIRRSSDNGMTWKSIECVVDFPYGQSAYSSMTILKNGMIAVFYEKYNCFKDEVAIFSLGWLINGKDSLSKRSK